MSGIGWKDVDEALGRLEAVLRPRVGKKMTAVVLKNLVGMKEHGALPSTVLHALHQSLDAYARIPESGTPFPLGVAKAIGDAGCLKLTALNWRMRDRAPNAALQMLDVDARSVASHADALAPAYGLDDTEFTVRVAWRNSHHYRQNLVVGRSLNRNDPAPTAILFDAWHAQGARGVPIAAVPVEFDAPGVIYALGDEPTTNILQRFSAKGFVFEPDHGDPIALDDVRGLQRFFAKVPLAITPQTLAWIVHLVRFAFPGAVIDVDDGLTVEWAPHEDAPLPSPAAALLGIVAAPPPERDQIRIRAGTTVLTYAPGELS